MTKKKINFCINYIQTHNARQSALSAGFSQNFADKRAYQLLRDVDVQEKITYLEERFYRDEFKKLALKSVQKLDDILSSSESESVQLGAVKLALELAGVSEKDENIQSVEIKVQLPNDL